MSKPKVLVTGASGLIGGLVLRGLARPLRVQRPEPARGRRGSPTPSASITDLDAVRRAVAGQDMVLHLAGETKNADDWDDHFEVTAGGTINVLRAAADGGRAGGSCCMSTGSTMCGWEWDDSLPYGRAGGR